MSANFGGIEAPATASQAPYSGGYARGATSPELRGKCYLPTVRAAIMGRIELPENSHPDKGAREHGQLIGLDKHRPLLMCLVHRQLSDYYIICTRDSMSLGPCPEFRRSTPVSPALQHAGRAHCLGNVSL